MEGFLDGYKDGVRNNPYDGEENSNLYNEGYQDGIEYYINEDNTSHNSRRR